MKNNELQDLIIKCVVGEASSQEHLLLDTWRSESTENENLFQEYAQIWDVSDSYEPTDFQPDAEKAYINHLEILSTENTTIIDLTEEKTFSDTKINETNELENKPTKIFSIQRIAGIAAIFTLVFGTLYLFNAFSSTSILFPSDPFLSR